MIRLACYFWILLGLIWSPNKAHADHLTAFTPTFKEFDASLNANPQSLITQIGALLEDNTLSAVDRGQALLILSEAHLLLTYPDDALTTVEQGLSLIGANQQPWLHHRLLLNKAIAFDLSGQADKGLTLANQVVEWAENHQSQWLLIEGLSARGHLQIDMGRLNLAMADFQRAYELAPQSGGEVNQANIAPDIAMLFDARNETEQSIPYFQQAVDYQEAQGNPLALSIALYGLGRAYVKMGALEMGQNKLQRSYDLATQVQDVQGQAYAQKELATVAIAQGRFESAINLLVNAKNVFESANNAAMLRDVSFKLAQAYLAQGQLDAAEAQLVIATRHQNKQSEPGNVVDLWLLTAKLHAARNDYQSAYDLLLNIRAEEAKIQSNSNRAELNRMQAELDLLNKERENLELAQKNTLQEQKLKAQQQEHQLMVLLVMASLLAVSLMFYLIYRSYRHRKKLQFLAEHDSLTGVYNRTAAMERINQLIQTQSPLVLAMIDIDHFKQINDRFGHAVGDEVLIQFSQICSEMFEEHAVVGRLGGEEFLVVFKKWPLAKVVQHMHQFKNRCFESVKVGRRRKKLTFSAGLSLFHKQQTAALAIQQADMAMYRAKAQGRNRIIIYQES